jgi:hypothetical protein
MKKHVLVLTTSAFILAYGAIAASAQQTPGSRMMQQPSGSSTNTDQQQGQQQPSGERNPGMMRDGGMMGERGMMGRGMMGERGGMMHGMMGRGMMGHGMMGHMGHRRMMGGLALRIIFALMDSDGDGTVSLQEFQAAHEKIFRAMDANKDGVLTMDEMQAFMHGSRRPTRGKARSEGSDESGDED